MNEIFDQLLADPTVTAVGSTLGAALVALWIAAAWWAYTDAARRTDNTLAALLAAAWIVASTPLLMPLSLPIYALARPQHSAAEQRTRRLTAELVDELERDAAIGCLGCGATVEAGWLRCPTCTTWLSLPCAQCGAWSERTLAICPYCGGEERAEPVPESPALSPAPTRLRRGHRRFRPAAAARQPAARPASRRAGSPESRPAGTLAVR